MANVIKVQLDGEMRRVNLRTQDGVAQLVETVAQLFPRIGSFKLVYTDDEHDVIRVGKDEDLLEALSNQTSGRTLRLTVVPDAKPVDVTPPVPPKPKATATVTATTFTATVPDEEIFQYDEHGRILHLLVKCDVCRQMPIAGVRYKCADCPDYDMCETCEALNQHQRNHVLLKMKVPMPIKVASGSVAKRSKPQPQPLAQISPQQPEPLPVQSQPQPAVSAMTPVSSPKPTSPVAPAEVPTQIHPQTESQAEPVQEQAQPPVQPQVQPAQPVQPQVQPQAQYVQEQAQPPVQPVQAQTPPHNQQPVIQPMQNFQPVYHPIPQNQLDQQQQMYPPVPHSQPLQQQPQQLHQQTLSQQEQHLAKYADKIKRMHEMGFVLNDEVLCDLLKCHCGDVAKVVEILIDLEM